MDIGLYKHSEDYSNNPLCMIYKLFDLRTTSMEIYKERRCPSYQHKKYQGNLLYMYNCTGIFQQHKTDIAFSSCSDYMGICKAGNIFDSLLDSEDKMNLDMRLDMFY